MKIEKGRVILDRILTELDKVLLEFVSILEKRTKYAVVSGYVSIIFGRARGTEDIDVIIPPMAREGFLELHKEFSGKEWWCINPGGAEALYDDYLMRGTAIRFAKKDMVIPNIEVRFAKDEIDDFVITNPLVVETREGSIALSLPEVQIPYKRIILGSEKDEEDALHLEEIFKESLDKNKLREWEAKIRTLKARGR